MKRIATQPVKTPELDQMLNRTECAAWLRMGERNLFNISEGMKPTVPGFRVGSKTVLYHPRTIIAHLARKNGVALETVAASFGIDLKREKQ